MTINEGWPQNVEESILKASTARRRDIMRLLCASRTTLQVAAFFDIPVKTVEEEWTQGLREIQASSV